VENFDYPGNFRRKHGLAKMVVYVLAMLITFWFQSRVTTQTTQGVIAQIQVILSVFLVLSLPKYGYITVVSVMGTELGLVLWRLFAAQDWRVLPGLLVCSSTLAVATIISLFGRSLNRKHGQLQRSQQELSLLNRDLAEASQKALHLVNHDPVTGLKNATCLRGLIDEFHGSREAGSSSQALVLLELENFKTISSILGQRNGEQILRETAHRIETKASLLPAVAARLDGGCFALFAPFDPSTIEASIRAIQHAIHEPLAMNEEILEIRSCAGYALAEGDAIDTESLLRCADLALASSREERRSSIKRYDSRMASLARRRADLSNEMESALKRHEFEMRYQPQIDAATGRVVGAEALVRWNNVRLDNPGPEEFIPLAEQNGQIVPMGKWILEQACRDAACWPAGWTVAVNISAGQFINRDFEDEIEQMRDDSGLGGSRLKLEVTESVLIGGELKVEERLSRLRSRSMTVSLDDFGTGYSSLSYLTRIPLDELKIDRSFVQAMESDPKVLAIVETILRLAKLLDLSTTAEGVETQSQANLLASMGCDRFQGFLYARPLTQRDLLARYSQAA